MPVKNSHYVEFHCDVHGRLKQIKKNFLKTSNCFKCLGRGLNITDYLIMFEKIHSNKYNYEFCKKDNIKNSNQKITIVCPIHDKFEQKVSNHKNGHGCPKCVGKGLSELELKTKTERNMADTVDISITNFSVKVNDPNNAICKLNGKFNCTITSLNNGICCKICRYKKMVNTKRYTTEEIINKFCAIHGTKYEYDSISYTDTKTQVSIKCHIHGYFKQQPSVHLLGHGCPKCGILKLQETKLLRYNNRTYNNQKQVKETNLKKYGVEHLSYLGNLCSYKKKDYRTPSGKILKIQGYEHFLLDELFDIYDETDIITQWNNMPEIFYNEKRRYFPDVYISSEQKFFEVKSEYTLFSNIEINKRKFEAVKIAGYKFELIVYDKNGTNISNRIIPKFNSHKGNRYD